MDILQGLIVSLSSPMVLAFALGVLAALVKSDLEFPREIYAALTIYRLFAIGFKGGAKLEGVSPAQFWLPALLAIGLCVSIPLWSYAILRLLGKFNVHDSAALAAHYGSVSAVTFGEALAFLDILKVPHEGFLPALLAIMEIPAILITIALAFRLAPRDPHASGAPSTSLSSLLHHLLTSKGIILLLGGMLIGLASGKKGFEQVGPFFDTPFRGVLTLFLLEIGLVTGRRFADLQKAGPFLILFAIAMPLFHGALGVFLAHLCGMSVGGATVVGTLAASASYIAAPAAVRVALPQASPALYLTASLAITFPLNVVLGIPLYYTFAKLLGTA